jgi:hypothetical protein
MDLGGNWALHGDLGLDVARHDKRFHLSTSHAELCEQGRRRRAPEEAAACGLWLQAQGRVRQAGLQWVGVVATRRNEGDLGFHFWPIRWIFGLKTRVCFVFAGRKPVRTKISYFFATDQFECSKSKKLIFLLWKLLKSYKNATNFLVNEKYVNKGSKSWNHKYCTKSSRPIFLEKTLNYGIIIN